MGSIWGIGEAALQFSEEEKNMIAHTHLHGSLFYGMETFMAVYFMAISIFSFFL